MRCGLCFQEIYNPGEEMEVKTDIDIPGSNQRNNGIYIKRKEVSIGHWLRI